MRFTLEIDRRGRATLPPEVFDHLGIKPGDKLKMTYLPDGEVSFQALRPPSERIEPDGEC
jgi:AbrB family looped-hinge helix DNA binding protein